MEHSIKELQDNSKKCNIYIIGIPEGEKKTEAIFKAIMTENFP